MVFLAYGFFIITPSVVLLRGFLILSFASEDFRFRLWSELIGLNEKYDCFFMSPGTERATTFLFVQNRKLLLQLSLGPERPVKLPFP